MTQGQAGMDIGTERGGVGQGDLGGDDGGMAVEEIEEGEESDKAIWAALAGVEIDEFGGFDRGGSDLFEAPIGDD